MTESEKKFKIGGEEKEVRITKSLSEIEGGVLMDFFTRAMDTLAVAGKGVSKKASEVSAVTKANLKVVNGERDLQDMFRQLGEEFFEKYPEQAAELFGNIVGRIEKKQKQLEKDREDLARLKGQKACPHCGQIISVNAKFCEKCGENAEVIEQIEQPEEDSKENEEEKIEE